MTVASAVESDHELELVESGHICPEKALADLVSRRTGHNREQQHP
jgi:3,4-dihydroxy-2-butanone 4-phosphate synthase